MKRGEGVWGSAEKLWKFYRQRAEINEMKQAEHSSKEKRTLTNYQAGSFSQQQQRWRSDCRPAFNATVFLATSHFLPARPLLRTHFHGASPDAVLDVVAFGLAASTEMKAKLKWHKKLMGYVGGKLKWNGRKKQKDMLFVCRRFMIHQGHIEVNGFIFGTKLFEKVFKWENKWYLIPKKLKETILNILCW